VKPGIFERVGTFVR